MNIDEIEKAHKVDMQRGWPESIDVALNRESALIAMVRELQADKAGLVKALEFYADILSHSKSQSSRVFIQDRGGCAKSALAKHGGKV